MKDIAGNELIPFDFVVFVWPVGELRTSLLFGLVLQLHPDGGCEIGFQNHIDKMNEHFHFKQEEPQVVLRISFYQVPESIRMDLMKYKDSFG